MSSLASRAHRFNWQNASKGNSSPRPSFRANELYVCLSTSLPFPVTHTCPVCRVRRLDQGRCLKGVVCGPKSARGGNVSCPLFWLFDEHFPRPAIAGSMCFRDVTLSNSPTHEIDTLIPTLLMGKRWPVWLKWLSLGHLLGKRKGRIRTRWSDFGSYGFPSMLQFHSVPY